MWNKIGTRTFSALNGEPYEGFWKQIESIKLAFEKQFKNNNWNVSERTIENRPILFGVTYEHGALVLPVSELNEIEQKEYFILIEQVLNNFPNFIPYIVPMYKKL